MGELANFPMLSQLGDSDVNRYYDCVPASLAAALEYLTHRAYTAGEIKDAVYSPGYVGGTAARNYIDYCKAAGADLYAIDNANGNVLVNDARAELAAGHPVLITEPDPYSSDPTMSHVVVLYAWDDAGMTAMDPFIAKPVYKSNGEWASQFEYSEIWGVKALMGIPAGWRDDGTALHNPFNSYVVTKGFRDHVLKNAWAGDNYPEENEQGRNPLEDSNPRGFTAGTCQVFRFSMLEWTPTSGVFIASVGQELATTRQELTTANSKVNQLQAYIDGLKNTPPPGPAADVKATVQKAIQELQILLQ